jgi:superfamily II DNA or RNA helicase
MPVDTITPVGPYQVDITQVDLANPAATNPPSAERADGTLYPFQVDIAAALSNQTSAAIVARSGIGKMEITVAVAKTHLEAQNEVDRVVILTNNRHAYQWMREILKTTLPNDVFDSYGPAGERWRTYSAGPQRWTVAPYSLLISDADVLETIMPSSLLVIDALPQVKNPEAQRTVATLRLAKAAARRLTLLQTPQNHSFAQWRHILTTALDPHETDLPSVQQACRDSYQMVGAHTIVTFTQQN